MLAFQAKTQQKPITHRQFGNILPSIFSECRSILVDWWSCTSIHSCIALVLLILDFGIFFQCGLLFLGEFDWLDFPSENVLLFFLFFFYFFSPLQDNLQEATLERLIGASRMCSYFFLSLLQRRYSSHHGCTRTGVSHKRSSAACVCFSWTAYSLRLHTS